MNTDKIVGVCDRCNGRGWHYAYIKDRSGKRYNAPTIPEEHVVVCDAPYCVDGKVTESSRKHSYEMF